MVARPSELPKWASDGGADVTTPSAPQQEAGYDTPNPRRGYANWLALRTYEWLAWLDQALRPTDLELADGPLPGGTAPTTSPAGLGSAASVFSGRGVVGGVVVGGLTPIVSPAYTYTGSRDTYWDLSDVAGWTAVVVANGAGEPAVTANSVRFYKVVTNATDKTSVQDRRPSVIRRLASDFVNTVRHVWPNSIDIAASGAPTTAQLATPHQTFFAGDNGTAQYETIISYEKTATGGAALALRDHLIRNNTGTDRLQIVRAQGLVRDPTANRWIAEDTEGYLEFIQAGKRFVWAITGLTIANTYTDAALLALNPAFRLDYANGLRLDTSAFEPGRAHIEHVRSADIYTLIRLDQTPADESIAEYVGANMLGTGVSGWCRAVNAIYNRATGDWDRAASGEAWIEIHNSAGRTLAYHAAGGSASWDDQVAAGDWVISTIESSLSTTWNIANAVLAGDLLATGDVQAGDALRGDELVLQPAPGTVIANTLYVNQFIRAKGTLSFDGAGNCAIVEAVGISAAFTFAANRIVVTLQQPMTSANFQVFANAWNTANNTGLYNAHAKPLSTTTFSIGVSGVVNADTELNLATSGTPNFRVDFLVMGLQ